MLHYIISLIDHPYRTICITSQANLDGNILILAAISPDVVDLSGEGRNTTKRAPGESGGPF